MTDRSMLHNIINKDELLIADRQLARQMTVIRYKMARAACFGSVVDAACDAGYGTWFLSLNPDVERVTGIDVDDAALDAARGIFGRVDHTRPGSIVEFRHGNLNGANPFGLVEHPVDVLVTLETLEHLTDPIAFLTTAEARGFGRIVASFPSFKTTHFNPHHLHDLTRSDIETPMHARGWITNAHHNLFGLCDFLVLDRTTKPDRSPNP